MSPQRTEEEILRTLPASFKPSWQRLTVLWNAIAVPALDADPKPLVDPVNVALKGIKEAADAQKWADALGRGQPWAKEEIVKKKIDLAVSTLEEYARKAGLNV